MGNKLCCCINKEAARSNSNYNSETEDSGVHVQLQQMNPNGSSNRTSVRPFHNKSHIRGDVVDFHRVSNCDDKTMMTEENHCEILQVKNLRKSKDILDRYDGPIEREKVQGKDIVETKCDNEFWVFGYGSLVWKIDFPIECSRTGYIKGYLRRFYQNSIDHRGTKEKPGRVVTLIPSQDPDAKVFGMAYKIPDDKTKEVLKHLDFREKNGYERHYVEFFPIGPSESDAVPMNPITIYVATQDNESFAGSTGGLTTIADQILKAVGPSGTNREYVYQLANAMRHYFPDQSDEHLFQLENLLKEREQCSIPNQP